MKSFIFATNNAHKVEEVNSILNNELIIRSLKEKGIDFDIPEPFEKIKENACEKARVIYSYTGKNCFSEDTGLEVEALNGEPGVKSARYAGEGKSSDDNIEKLLTNLKKTSNRSAQFKTIVCLIINGEEFTFEGICKGTIIEERRGESGFGYDPVFVPEGSNYTFAEMSMTEKNKYSHRKKAIDVLADFLKSMK
ncbi:MAG: RdgB/HAM1 family non-canonical purine NTP pyrophosphatase [Ginsengibacter sp.]|jgi:XTP/dITP diphosphohydrolase